MSDVESTEKVESTSAPSPADVAKAVAKRAGERDDVVDGTARYNAAAARIAELEGQINLERIETMRTRIANDFGITGQDRDILMTGTDEETLTAQARRLQERLPNRGVKKKAPSPRLDSAQFGGSIFSGPSW